MMDLQENFADELGMWMFDSFQHSPNQTLNNNESNESNGSFNSSTIGLNVQAPVQAPNTTLRTDVRVSENGTVTLASRPDLTVFHQPQPGASQMQLTRSLRDAKQLNLLSEPPSQKSSIPRYHLLIPKPNEGQYSLCSSTYNEQLVGQGKSKGYITNWTKAGPVKVHLGVNEQNNNFSCRTPAEQDKCVTWLNKSKPFHHQIPMSSKSSFTESGHIGTTQLFTLSNVHNYSRSTLASAASSHTQLSSDNSILSIPSMVKPVTNFLTIKNNQSWMVADVPQPTHNSNTWSRSASCRINDTQTSSQVTSSDWLNQEVPGPKNFNTPSYVTNIGHKTKAQHQQLPSHHPKWQQKTNNNVFGLEEFWNQEPDVKNVSNGGLLLDDVVSKPEEISVPLSLDSSSESYPFNYESTLNQYEVYPAESVVNKMSSGGKKWLTDCQQILEDIDHNVVSLAEENLREESEVINRSFEIMESDPDSRPDNESLLDLYESKLDGHTTLKTKSQGLTGIDTTQTPSRMNGKRKPITPVKSPRARDPTFRGVVVKMKTKLQDDRSHLDIRAYFSCKKNCRRHQHFKKRYLEPNTETNEQPEIPLQSSAIVEKDFQPKEKKRRCPLLGKQCASCGTKKTPLWRDAEDGTSLCNACGIRFKKYRVRCTTCWHIPRKDTKTDPTCHRCGEILKVPPMSSKVCL